LSKSLRLYPDFEVLEHLPASGQEAFSLIARLKPDVVVLDFWIPGMAAPALTRLIVSKLPDCKVILLSWLYGPDQIREGLGAGAVGFLAKSVTVDVLTDVVRRALDGESPVCEQELDEAIRVISERDYQDEAAWQLLAVLTPREVEILKLMDLGRPIELVAKELTIRPSTVRNHIHNILVCLVREPYRHGSLPN